MCVLLHLLICTALRAHIIVVEALYKINYYYYYYYYYYADTVNVTVVVSGVYIKYAEILHFLKCKINLSCNCSKQMHSFIIN